MGCNIGNHHRAKHIQLSATTDAEQIRTWWLMWPDANFGVIMGARSRLVVLEIDGGDGEAALADLEMQHGWLPSTLEVHTDEGRHLCFDLRYGTKMMTKDISPSLELKADGA